MRRGRPLVVLTISFGAHGLSRGSGKASGCRAVASVARDERLDARQPSGDREWLPANACLAIPARPTCFVITGQLMGMQRIGLDVDLADVGREFIK